MGKAGASLELLGWLEEQPELTPQQREIVLNAYYALRELEGGSPLHPQHVEHLRAFEQSGLAAGRAE